MPEQSKTDATRLAIECLTLWLETGDEARVNAVKHIAGLIDDEDGPGPNLILVGLLNLSMLLAIRLAKAEGATRDDLLAATNAILQEISPRLPE